MEKYWNKVGAAFQQWNTFKKIIGLILLVLIDLVPMHSVWDLSLKLVDVLCGLWWPSEQGVVVKLFGKQPGP